MDFAALEANFRPFALQQAQQKMAEPETPKNSAAKRLAASLLPTIGGAVGAVGGSFVAPIAGTAAGGAGGAALGEALRQRLLGEDTNLKNIGVEGALGSVPGVLKGVKALKAAKGAKTAVAAEEVDRAGQVASGAESKSLLNKLSTAATRKGSGIKVDPGVGGISRADEAAETFQRLKISGPPEKQLRKIEEVMSTHGKQVDDILTKKPIKLEGSAVREQVTKALDDPLKYAELDLTTPGAQRHLNVHLDKFASSTDAKSINDYIKKLNPIASRAQDKIRRGVSITDKEAAALAAKKAGDEVLSEIPEIKPFKKDMAVLFERNPDVTKQSGKTTGIPLLGIKSNTAQQKLSGAMSKAGQITGNADVALQSTTGQTGKKVGKSLLNQFVTRTAAAPFRPDQSNSEEMNPNTTAASQSTTQTPTNQMMNDSMSPLNNNSVNNASDPLSGLDDAIGQAMAAGDYKGLSALLSVADYYDKKGGGAKKPMSSEASKTVSNAQVGIQAIDDFEKLIQEDPGAFGRTVIPGRGAVGGVLGSALGTSGIDAASQQIIDVIARLRTGAAISATEEARFKKFIPLPSDPENTRQQKLSYLKNQFSQVAQRAGGSQEFDPSEAMMAGAF